MIQAFLKKNWQWFAAIAIFLTISCVYFSPALDGYSLRMGDIKSYAGMSKEGNDYRELYNEESLWSSTSFSGMPTTQMGTRYINPLKKAYNWLVEIMTFPIFALFFALISFFILAKAYNAGFFIALTGALAYGLTTYNFVIMEAGHATKMLAIAFIPAVIGGMVMLYRNKNWWWALALFVIFFALELLVNHIQMTYYFAFVMLTVGVAEFIRLHNSKQIKIYGISFLLLCTIILLNFLLFGKVLIVALLCYLLAFVVGVVLIQVFNKSLNPFFLKRTGILFIGIVVALISNFANYYNTYQFAKKTMRGKPVITISANAAKGDSNRTAEQKKYDEFNQTSGLKRDYITQWSYGKGETWNLFVPTAKGDSRNVTGEIFDKLRDNVKNTRGAAKKVESDKFNAIVSTFNNSRQKVLGGYWGDQPFTSGPNYIGAIVVFLALMYLMFVHTPLKWGLLTVSILAIMLSWGKNLGGSIEDMWLTNFFIDYVPLYNKFRTVSSMLVIVNLVAPLMAILFLTHLAKNTDWVKKNILSLSIGAGVVLLVLIVLLINPEMVGLSSELEKQQIAQSQLNYIKNPIGASPEDLLADVVEVRSSIFRADIFRAIGLVLLAFGGVLLSVLAPKARKFGYAAIALFVLIDLWSVGTRYLNNEKNPQNKKEYIAWEKNKDGDNIFFAQPGDNKIFDIESAQNKQILEDVKTRQAELRANGDKLNRKNMEGIKFSSLGFNTNYRVMDLDNPFNSARASYFHKNTGGYSPAKLRRYQDMIDFYIQDELRFLNARDFDRTKVLNMLNNKYYLYQGQLFAYNPKVYGNAWFVNDVKWVDDNNAEILAIKETDVKNTAIIHKEYKNVITKPSGVDSLARIQMTSFSPRHLVYETTNSQNGLAVFSEVFYRDGWKAFIDGAEVPYSRANYIVRALNIPKGKHTIEFKFNPSAYSIGNTVNIIGAILMFVILAAAVYFGFKNNKPYTVEENE